MLKLEFHFHKSAHGMHRHPVFLLDLMHVAYTPHPNSKNDYEFQLRGVEDNANEKEIG